MNKEQVDQLKQDLDRAEVKLREGKFSYVEGHYCIRKANAIFGFGGWRRETLRLTPIREVTDYVQMKDGKPTGLTGYYVAYLCTVRLWVRDDDEWVATDGTGYGEAVTYGQAEGAAHEGAAKEAETDAMKRAMICWGDQFGLALYAKDQSHVTGDAPPRSSGGGGQRPAPVSPEGAPPCPKCGVPMVLRTIRKGDKAGQQFWGCPNWKPNNEGCDGVIWDVDAPAPAAAPDDDIPVDPNDDPFRDQ